jgi:hypothetical protein
VKEEISEIAQEHEQNAANTNQFYMMNTRQILNKLPLKFAYLKNDK